MRQLAGDLNAAEWSQYMVNKVLFISLFLALCVGCKPQEKKTPPRESPSLPFNNVRVTPSYPIMPVFESEYTYSVSPEDAYQEGYDNGYEQGVKDGRAGRSHGFGYDDSSEYEDYFEVRYIAGYEEGYEDGYREGSDKFNENEYGDDDDDEDDE